MREIEDKSIDLIVADPPYFQIMKEDWQGNKYEWDNQWKNLSDYIQWIRQIGTEFKRILKDNGSLYLFADDKICAYVQVELDKQFHLENPITWVKPNNLTMKGWTGYRSYAPITERILFYSKETEKTGLQKIYENPDCFKAIKEYMRGERSKICAAKGFKTQEEFNQFINGVSCTASVVSRHYFPDSQWVFPTADIYALLQTTGFFKREYEELRREYEELRRPFNQKTNYTDIWTFNIMGGAESTIHPTQKPLALISRIIDTSSKVGSIVLDPFMGSGTTAEACILADRNFIGFEKEPDYFTAASTRVTSAMAQSKISGWFA
jgi:site-specific DNA-methyltransferase (adenine-specific)